MNMNIDSQQDEYEDWTLEQLDTLSPGARIEFNRRWDLCQGLLIQAIPFWERNRELGMAADRRGVYLERALLVMGPIILISGLIGFLTPDSWGLGYASIFLVFSIFLVNLYLDWAYQKKTKPIDEMLDSVLRGQWVATGADSAHFWAYWRHVDGKSEKTLDASHEWNRQLRRQLLARVRTN